MAQEQPLPLVQPACRFLRSKNMYVSGTMDPARDDYEFDGDGYCWCSLTQNQMGPDQQVAEREDCIPGRNCYEAL